MKDRTTERPEAVIDPDTLELVDEQKILPLLVEIDIDPLGLSDLDAMDVVRSSLIWDDTLQDRHSGRAVMVEKVIRIRKR